MVDKTQFVYAANSSITYSLSNEKRFKVFYGTP